LARRIVGGDLAVSIDALTTAGTGRLLSHVLGLVFVVVLAGYLYRRKLFLRV